MWLWDRDYSKVMEVEKWRSERGEAISGDCCVYQGMRKGVQEVGFCILGAVLGRLLCTVGRGIKGG